MFVLSPIAAAASQPTCITTALLHPPRSTLILIVLCPLQCHACSLTKIKSLHTHALAFLHLCAGPHNSLTHRHTHSHTRTHTHSQLHKHTHAHTRTHTHKCTHAHRNTHIHTHSHIYTYTHIYIHTLKRTYTHIHTRTHIHPHLQPLRLL